MISEALFNRFDSDPKYSCTHTFFSMVRNAARSDTWLLNLRAGPGTQSEQ